MSDLDELIEKARKCAPGDCSTELAVIVHRLADALEAETAPAQGEPNDDREALSKEVLDLAVKTRNKADRWANTLGEIALGDEAYAEAELLRQASVALSRSTVPDAANELRAERDAALARIAELEVERDQALEGVADQRRGIARRMEDIAALEAENLDLEARIAEAAKLHRPFEWSFGYGPVKSCRGCADRGVPQEKAEWPCDTRKALDGAPEPEWEWEYRTGHIDRSRDDEAFVQGSTIAPSYVQQYVAEGGEAIKRKVSPWLPVEGESK